MLKYKKNRRYSNITKINNYYVKYKSCPSKEFCFQNRQIQKQCEEKAP